MLGDKVFVIFLFVSFTSGFFNGYPGQYGMPYPYMQQNPGGEGGLGEYSQSYGGGFNPGSSYPSQHMIPGYSSYAPQFSGYSPYSPMPYPERRYPEFYPQARYQGQIYPSPNYQGPNYLGANYQGPNYPGPNYPSPNYPGANYQGPNYPGPNYPGSNYPEPRYMESNYMENSYPEQYSPPGNGGYYEMQGQFPPGTQVYPANQPVPLPQAANTPYGNIPVEVIDVNENPETYIPNQFKIADNSTVDEENSKDLIKETKSILDFKTKPVKTTSYIKTEPTQTKIIRTLDPKGAKIHVEVQTSSPLSKKDNKDINTIENVETSTKPFSLFG